MKIYEELAKIQKALKAPKNQRNTFGNYNYRSCEDILEALKQIVTQGTFIIKDELVNLGDRYYVKATVTFNCNDEQIECSAFARESETKKGMDESQITGAASSYARKYALNGLLLIDDTKDADATNKHGTDKVDKKEPSQNAPQGDKPATTGNMSDKQSAFIIKIGAGLKDPYSPLSKTEVVELVRWKAKQLGVDPKSRAVSDAFLPGRDETIKPWEKFAKVFDEWMDWKQEQPQYPIFDENGEEVTV